MVSDSIRRSTNLRFLNRSLLGVAGIATLVLNVACSVVGINSGEQASYRVLDSEDKFELREYASFVVAETSVDAEFKEAGDIAFRRLFGYISGDNELKQKLAMTAPVIAEPGKGELIEMTSPVIGASDGELWRYQFVLPASFSIETAPAPLNNAVSLAAVPEKKVAVIRFSGIVSKEDVERKAGKLIRWMTGNSLNMASEPRWAGYNPPWTIPFFRRNEVMIDVTD